MNNMLMIKTEDTTATQTIDIQWSWSKSAQIINAALQAGITGDGLKACTDEILHMARILDQYQREERALNAPSTSKRTKTSKTGGKGKLKLIEALASKRYGVTMNTLVKASGLQPVTIYPLLSNLKRQGLNIVSMRTNSKHKMKYRLKNKRWVNNTYLPAYRKSMESFDVESINV